MRPTELYRYYDANGVLLYVGVSTDWLRRDAEHKQMSAWRSQISTVSVERFPTRRMALDAERIAIVAEKPRHNVRHAEQEVRRCSTPTKPTISVRLPDDLMGFVDEVASELGRSRNWVVVDLVRQAHTQDQTTH